MQYTSVNLKVYSMAPLLRGHSSMSLLAFREFEVIKWYTGTAREVRFLSIFQLNHHATAHS